MIKKILRGIEENATTQYNFFFTIWHRSQKLAGKGEGGIITHVTSKHNFIHGEYISFLQKHT